MSGIALHQKGLVRDVRDVRWSSVSRHSELVAFTGLEIIAPGVREAALNCMLKTIQSPALTNRKREVSTSHRTRT
jgi:hypothetical protein